MFLQNLHKIDEFCLYVTGKHVRRQWRRLRKKKMKPPRNHKQILHLGVAKTLKIDN